MTPHFLLFALIFGAVIFYIAVRNAPDKPSTILDENGLPRTYPDADDQSVQPQARRGKVR